MEWLAERLGYIVKPKDFAEPDKATWPEERVDDSVCCGKVSTLMQEGAHPSVVFKEIEKAKGELDQSGTRYSRDYEKAR